jgi:hypothetical protein
MQAFPQPQRILRQSQTHHSALVATAYLEAIHALSGSTAAMIAAMAAPSGTCWAASQS